MAIEALTDGYLALATTDFSGHVTDVDVDNPNDGNEITPINSENHDYNKGLGRPMLNFTVLNDYAASSIDATMRAALGTKVAFTAAHAGSSASATNPVYSGSVYVNQWKGPSGSGGSNEEISVSFPICGSMTIATS